MLSLTGISKRYGPRLLFDEASLQVQRGERIGLVGPNGAGKSTLFGMILGTEEHDGGQLAIEKHVKLGYLPQETAPVGDETVLELALAVTPDMVAMRRRLALIESGHAAHEADDDGLHHRFEEAGGYLLEPKAKKILMGLGFREKDFDRPARELSGGWVMRAHLARLLTGEPDLLMLDEPTNHLDLEALLWFQEYLRNYPGAILVISHDREFLNRLVNGIVEIRSRKLHRFTGNYERYVQQKDLQHEQQQAAYDKQKKEIENLKAFIDRFGAKASKAAQAQSKLKQIERMEKLEAPEADGPKLRFKFPQPVRSGRDVIFLKDIHMAYGENVVYRGMNFHGERGHRTVLVGPNGAGKSTLLKLLAGVLTPQSGARELGYQAKAGYFAQYRLDTLQAGRTVLEEGIDAALQASVRATEEFVRTVLGAFLFRGDDVFKKVSVLSGGEKSRLALVKLLLDPPNLLLMDEPTTHLDIPSIDALVAALKQYEGTLIFISHDVYFIKAIADHVVHVNAGVLTKYEGDYQYYLDRTAAISARVGLTATGTTGIAEPEKSEKAPKGENRKEQRRREAEARQDKSRARLKLAHQVQRLEAEMQQLEARLAELTAELEKPETYDTPGRTMEINKELGAVNKKLPAVTAEWETASSQLAEIAG